MSGTAERLLELEHEAPSAALWSAEACAVVQLENPVGAVNQTPSHERLASVSLPPLADTRGKTWLLAVQHQFAGSQTDLPELYQLFSAGCIACGVHVVPNPHTGVVKAYAVLHKVAHRRLHQAPADWDLRAFPTARGPIHIQNAIAGVLLSLHHASSCYMRSYSLVPSAPRPCPSAGLGSLEQSEALRLEVETEWKTLPEIDIQNLIIACKALPVKGQSPREAMIARCGDRILANMARARAVLSGMQVSATCPSVFPLSSFCGLHSLRLVTYDVDKCEAVSLSVPEFLERGKFVSYSVVLLGKSCSGKTSLARSMCSNIALSEQSGRPDAHFVQVSTLDSLYEVRHLLDSSVPICFDEVTPERPDGPARRLNPDALKKLTNVQGSGGLGCRYHNPFLPAGEARIFTSNAEDPSQWHHSLPAGFPDHTKEQIASMSPDVLAIFRRSMFGLVRHDLAQSPSKNGRALQCEEAAAKRMRLVLGSGSSSSCGPASAPVAPNTPRLL